MDHDKPFEGLNTWNLILLDYDLLLNLIYFLKQHLLNFGVHRLLKSQISLSVLFFQVDKLLVVVDEVRGKLSVHLYQNHAHLWQSMDLYIYILKHCVRSKPVENLYHPEKDKECDCEFVPALSKIVDSHFISEFYKF